MSGIRYFVPAPPFKGLPFPFCILYSRQKTEKCKGRKKAGRAPFFFRGWWLWHRRSGTT